MPFFCRLESRLLLRARDLDRFLIGRSAIRIWRLWRGGDMRLICPTSATGTACMTQTHEKVYQRFNLMSMVFCVSISRHFRDIAGRCGPPEIWIENRRWAPWTEKFGREVARLAP